ncbi:MAG TPA: signal peptidase I [Syntrophomonadaceae bacterium]|nr:signal peptidase I [Syntrophomonadaceae bacterium]HPR92850.1 signal peptidase I [Syntrophomonadaceae bacterium]
MRKTAIISLCILLALLVVGCQGSNKSNTQKLSFGGESMVPTFENGEKVTVDTGFYTSAQPQRGDIIVFKDENGAAMIKRVIGLPGEQVEIKDKKVYIDGEELKEDYLYEQNSTEASGDSAWTISDKSVFVMGDNRAHSNDSRNFGAVPYERVAGKVLK